MYLYRVEIFFFSIFFTKVIFSSQFQLALEAHKKNDFSQAEQLYCALPIKTSSIMFNMGLLAYRQQLYAKAIGFWRVACLYTTIGNSCVMMYRVAQAVEKLKKEQEVPIEWVAHPMDSKNIGGHLLFLLAWYIQVMPLWIVQLLFMLCSVIMAIALFQILKNNLRSRKIIAIICVGIIPLYCMLYSINLRTALYGVVQEKTELRQGPDDFFESTGQIVSPFTEVIIHEKHSSWYKIQYQDLVGWLPERTVYCINNNKDCGISIINWSMHH